MLFGKKNLLMRKNKEYQALEKGILIFGNEFTALMQYFDNEFKRIAKRVGAEESKYPTLISRDILNRVEFFSSFPEFATYIEPLNHTKTPKYLLQQAVCYHSYSELTNSKLTKDFYILTAVGNCFRFEGKALTDSPERLWDFTMREIIFFGSSKKVTEIRKRLVTEVIWFVNKLGLTSHLEEATDPFFLGTSRGKLLIQKLKKLKQELRAPLTSKKNIAIASFNNHEGFFTEKTNIRLPNKKFAHSGCVAFGLERWAYVFLTKYGADKKKW